MLTTQFWETNVHDKLNCLKSQSCGRLLKFDPSDGHVEVNLTSETLSLSALVDLSYIRSSQFQTILEGLIHCSRFVSVLFWFPHFPSCLPVQLFSD